MIHVRNELFFTINICFRAKVLANKMVGMQIVKRNVEDIIYVQNNIKQKWVNAYQVQNGILKDFVVMIQGILMHLVKNLSSFFYSYFLSFSFRWTS